MNDCVTVQSQSANLKKIRKFVRNFLTTDTLTLPLEEREELVLAIDEACQNIIRHAYLDLPEGKIQICLQHHTPVFKVHIFDQGHPADVAKIKPRALDDIKIGGLGTYFMNTIMDRVEFIKAENPWTNHLVMTKEITTRKKAVYKDL